VNVHFVGNADGQEYSLKIPFGKHCTPTLPLLKQAPACVLFTDVSHCPIPTPAGHVWTSTRVAIVADNDDATRSFSKEHLIGTLEGQRYPPKKFLSKHCGTTVTLSGL
jgi:hypothetical protein